MTALYWMWHALATEAWSEEHVGLAIIVFAVVLPLVLIFWGGA